MGGNREEPDLENLLERAAEDPESEVDFLHALLQARVCVLPQTEGMEGEEAAPKGRIELLRIELPDGRMVVPFFTSEAVLEQCVDRGLYYLTIHTQHLFRVAEGEELVLNLGGRCGKRFLPEEVRELLQVLDG